MELERRDVSMWRKQTIKKMARDEGSRRKGVFDRTECHLCCMSERKEGRKEGERRGGREERSKGKDLGVPAYPKSAQRTACCYS